MNADYSRRSFLMGAAGAVAVSGIPAAGREVIQGFEEVKSNVAPSDEWTPASDRRLRVGIIGYGVCQFGASFSFQHHPSVDVVAVSDLIPERCDALAKACYCEKTYPSLEELIKDDNVEAVFIATDAPSHAQHAIDALRHGKHVACAVPATYGSLEDADRLFEAVKETGLHYMMFETSAYHDEVHAMREIFKAGGFGKLIYTEGEYYHYMETPIDSFRGWRVGLPPQWYPTHSNGYYTCVSGGSFTEVSCMGIPSSIEHLQPDNNPYANPFGTEIALFRTSEGGMARMAVSWDTPGLGGEVGRGRGQFGSMTGMQFDGIRDISNVNIKKPALPSDVRAGGHGGSHGNLCEEFVRAILEERRPLVDIAWSLNMTVAGIVAHESALKDGELLKIPQYVI